jgi:hypothetical protein
VLGEQMLKIKVVFILGCLFLSGLLLAEQPTILSELSRPAILIVQDEKVFVLEATTIFIYNLKDLKLIKKFGKAGEGPGEFMINPQEGRPMSMSLYKNNILVNSIAKMSYFDMEGNFKKERKVVADALLFPVKNKFIGIGPVSTEGSHQLLGFRLLEENLKDSKILHLSDFELGSGIQILLLPVVNFTYNPVYKDRIYINTSNSEFKIDVFNTNGDKLYTINKDYMKIATPKDYKDQCLDWFKSNPQFKRQVEFIKKILEVRKHFPSIRDLQIADDILHVITYKRKKKLWECILMDLKGKELGRKFIPLEEYIPLSFYPILYSSYKGNMYTLVENEEDENWEIHVTKLR